MEVTSGPLEWDLSEDRDILAQFLKTRTGSRLIPKLAEACPLLHDGAKENVNQILIRSGEARGFQRALSMILSLATPEPEGGNEPVATGYPPLNDDAAWGDGKKLTE